MRILGIDLSGLARRNYEVAKADTEPFSGMYERTVNWIARNREGFDRVVLACDSGPSFRKAISPSYKANRPETPAAYAEQLRKVIERLAADGCHILRGPQLDSQGGPAVYAEADDVLAWLARECAQRGHSLRIASGDKDLLALVDDEAAIEVQKFDGGVWTAQAVKEKIGVDPARVRDWLALAGDASDGYKPFPGNGRSENGNAKPGIGDKTAVEIVNAHFKPERPDGAWLIDAMASNAIPAGNTRALLEHGGGVGIVKALDLGYAMATLRADLPLDFAAIEAEAEVKPITSGNGFRDAREPTPEQAQRSEPARERQPAPPNALAERAPDAIANAEAINPFALQPRSPEQLWMLAETLFNARVYAQFPNAESVFACILEANERGVPAGAALRNAYVVKGKLAWSASFLVGLVRSSPLCKVFRIVDTTDKRAVVEYQHANDDKARTFEFTIEEAQRAGWLKSGPNGDGKWITNPRTMLRWAAYRECARFVWPEIVGNTYTPDELRGGEVIDAEFEAA